MSNWSVINNACILHILQNAEEKLEELEDFLLIKDKSIKDGENTKIVKVNSLSVF